MIAGIGRAADRAGAANDWYADRSAGTQKNESPSSSFELAHVVISAIMSAADKVSGLPSRPDHAGGRCTSGCSYLLSFEATESHRCFLGLG